MYIYICMYTCIRIYIYIHMYTYIYILSCMYIYIYYNVCIYIYIRIHVYNIIYISHIYTCIHYNLHIYTVFTMTHILCTLGFNQNVLEHLRGLQWDCVLWCSGCCPRQRFLGCEKQFLRDKESWVRDMGVDLKVLVFYTRMAIVVSKSSLAKVFLFLNSQKYFHFRLRTWLNGNHFFLEVHHMMPVCVSLH